MFFIRFMFCLGVGLVGLCMVLLTVMETVFADWDLAAEFRIMMRRRQHFVRQLLDREARDHHGHGAYGARINAYGRNSRPEPRIEYAAKALPVAADQEPEREPASVA